MRKTVRNDCGQHKITALLGSNFKNHQQPSIQGMRVTWVTTVTLLVDVCAQNGRTANSGPFRSLLLLPPSWDCRTSALPLVLVGRSLVRGCSRALVL